MDYVDSRYYDPEIGRWISADDTEYLGINGNNDEDLGPIINYTIKFYHEHFQ